MRGARRSSGSEGSGHGTRVESVRGWIWPDRYPGCSGGGSGQRLRGGGHPGLCARSALSAGSMAAGQLQCRSQPLSSPRGPLRSQTFAPRLPSLHINKTATRESAAGRVLV